MTLFTIQERRGTSAAWALANTVLEAGQWGIELDTGKAKLGNGVTSWNSLPYYIDEAKVAALILEVMSPYFVMLEVGQGAESVPVGTPVDIPIFRKAIEE